MCGVVGDVFGDDGAAFLGSPPKSVIAFEVVGLLGVVA
jgi:hypothetical protein